MEESNTKLIDTAQGLNRPLSVRTKGMHSSIGTNNYVSNRISTDSSMFPSVLDWSLVLAELESSDFDLLE